MEAALLIRGLTPPARPIFCHPYTTEHVCPATVEDAELLAQMNRCLIEDEGSRNPMSLDQLARRMREWLSGEWRAVLVLVDAAPAGYLLFCQRSDEYDADQQEVYVRQFFIDRQHRGKGIGARAFAEIAEQYFPAHARIVLDVLARNEAGRRFWEKIGFAPYSHTLQRRGSPGLPADH